MSRCWMTLTISTLVATSAQAGDHHKAVYYLPVQAAPAPVAAAPVQFVAIQPKHHHRPVYLLAAPVQTSQVVQAAAAPVLVTVIPTTAMTAVAASSSKSVTYVINGTTYVSQQGTTTAAGAVAGAPVLGGLTEAQRATILAQLKEYYSSLKTFPSLDADSVKKMVRSSAVSRYEETIKDAVNTDDENKAVDSLTNEAIGGAPTTTTTTDTSKSGTTATTMTTVVNPAPVEYFLPVRVKSHPFHRYP